MKVVMSLNKINLKNYAAREVQTFRETFCLRKTAFASFAGEKMELNLKGTRRALTTRLVAFLKESASTRVQPFSIAGKKVVSVTYASRHKRD